MSTKPASRPDAAVDDGIPEPASRARVISEIVFNAFIVVACCALFWKSESLPSSMWEPLGSGSFPRLVLGGLIGFNAILIATKVPALAGTRPSGPGTVRRWLWKHRLAFAMLALFLVYVIGIHWIGFAWASLAFLLVTQILLGARSPRALAVVLVISLAFSFGLNLLFGHLFNILLPSGALFD